jgi:transcription initiation factor TFIIIB Brf1 subunit/transcription initiation factor TFIIB|uniref:Transcription factor TFIIB cyclin-like domain-containing protein n=1 Tax=viral metagenome TaxID=1070528 RepID=A0A6C0CTU4_9ZZZZ
MCKHSFVVDDGEYVCNLCGIIGDRFIDEGAEWRNYDDGKEEKGRTGFTTSDLLPDSSYGSVISFKGISSTNTNMKALQRLSTWSLSSNSDRSWLGIFDNIQMACALCNLPKSIIMDACGLYKTLDDAQKVRGETRRALMGATVYVSCRQNGASRTYQEVADIFRVSIRSLCKAVSRFSVMENTVLQTQLGIAERLCASLSLNDKQRNDTFQLLLTISTKSEDDFEHTPKTIVAGVVAYVLGFKTKAQMKQVADASGVSALSIHKLVSKI